HERPGALAGDRAVLLEVGARRLEVVGVRLELLPYRVALALDRLAVGEVDRVESVEPRFEIAHRRLVGIEVASLAGAEIAVAVGVGDLRRAALEIDQGDEVGTEFGWQEPGTVEQFEPRGRHAPDTRIAQQVLARSLARIRHAPVI